MKTLSKIYNTAVYLRLSREDGDRLESDSIANQQAFIETYLNSHSEFRLYKVYADRNYTGTNFDRPKFKEMMNDIMSGKVNCVIVKDLSRLGREYIDTGRYLLSVFPAHNTRFIAINDGVDTLDTSNMDFIRLHFKNLINDMYCGDTSLKVRSILQMKCKNGEFVSAFAPYGYIKNPENKNQLIVDETVRSVVTDIFNWKLLGMSALRIAEKLNSLGIASPMEHKRELGIKYNYCFRKNTTSKWDAKSVARILQNKVYIGTLEQSKTTTPNYKIKVCTEKPKSEWISVENCHEAIIDKELFEQIGRLLAEDTRISEDNNLVYPLSGILKCGECGGNITRKTIPSGGKKYVYYVCINNKNKCGCTNKTALSVNRLNAAVLKSLNAHINSFIMLSKLSEYILTLPYRTREIEKLNAQKIKSEEHIEKIKKFKLSLYEDYSKGFIDSDDYKDFNDRYNEEIEEYKQTINNLIAEVDILTADKQNSLDTLKKFAAKGEITELTRETAVSLIDKVIVTDKEHIEVQFKFQSQIDILNSYIRKSPDFKDLEKAVI